MDIHILTPFYRRKFAKTLVHYWRQLHVYWYPLMAPSDYVEFPDEDWIRPIMVDELKKGDNCFVKIDNFRNTQEIIDEDYYGVACDETLYEPGFFHTLHHQTAKVIVCSSYRGDRTPPGGDYTGPPWTCVVNDVSDLQRNNIGMGQYFVKGEILKAVPYAEVTKEYERNDDGHYIVEMRKRYPNDIAFMKNWYSFANYLQPGRWTTIEYCIKPHWEMPKYIGIDIEKEKDTLHEEPTV